MPSEVLKIGAFVQSRPNPEVGSVRPARGGDIPRGHGCLCSAERGRRLRGRRAFGRWLPQDAGSVPSVDLHSQTAASFAVRQRGSGDARSPPRSMLWHRGRAAGPWLGDRELLPWLMPALVLSSSAVFEEPEDPSNRSFFSEIISSISDVKFSHSGRYIMTRDYLTVKVWDLNMENRPIETYQVSVAWPGTCSGWAPTVLLPTLPSRPAPGGTGTNLMDGNIVPLNHGKQTKNC